MREIILEPLAMKAVDEIFSHMEQEYLKFHKKLPGKAKTKRQQGIRSLMVFKWYYKYKRLHFSSKAGIGN